MKRLFVLLAFVTLAFAQAPDIQSSQTFTGATAGAAVWNSPTIGAATWQLTFTATGFTAVTLQIESSEDCAGVSCGVWTAVASSFVVLGSNPITWTSTSSPPVNTTIAIVFAHPWLRVNVTSVTGVGTITTLLLGYKGTTNGLGGGASVKFPITIPEGGTNATSAATGQVPNTVSATSAPWTYNPILGDNTHRGGLMLGDGGELSGIDQSLNGLIPPTIVRGADQTGTGAFSSAVAGGLDLAGGNNASSHGASQGGSIEVEGGQSTNGGQQGILVLGQNYTQGSGTITQWNLICLDPSGPVKANDCGANPTTALGVTDYHSGAVVEVHLPGSISPANSSNTAVLGDTVCAGAASPKVTDSGGASPCGAGQGFTVGQVIAVSGTYFFADGASAKITTSQPLIQLWKTWGVGAGDVPLAASASMTAREFKCLAQLGVGGCNFDLVATTYQAQFNPHPGLTNTSFGQVDFPETLVSGTYTSGITATGLATTTCTLTGLNGNGNGYTVTVPLTGLNTIAGGTALTVTAGGFGFMTAPTSATAGNGTATCSGTAVIATVLGVPAQESIIFHTQLPQTWSQLYFNLEWVSAIANAGVSANWYLQLACVPSSGTSLDPSFDAARTYTSTNQATANYSNNIGEQALTLPAACVQTSGSTPGPMLFGQIYRATGDTLEPLGSPSLIEAVIHP